jgi:hypothetical protein
VTIVEVKTTEEFVVEVLHAGLQKRLSVCRAPNRLACGQGFLEVTPCKHR